MEHPLLERGLEAESQEPRPTDTPDTRHSKLTTALGYLLPPAIALALLAIGWELWIRIADVKVYIVPPPSTVLERLFTDIGFFARHGGITLWEAMAGFGLGTTVAFTGGDYHGPLQINGEESLSPGRPGESDPNRRLCAAVRDLVRIRVDAERARRLAYLLLPRAGQRHDWGSGLSTRSRWTFSIRFTHRPGRSF